MTHYAWRIASDGAGYRADDLSGEGAKRGGGRWNRRGQAVVYAASSISLACLETLVHINALTLPVRRFLVRIDIPEDIWAQAQHLDQAHAPTHWNATPWERGSVEFGSTWLRNPGSPAILLVPSVVVPEESNILLNPNHPDTARIVSGKFRPWTYDFRLKG